MTKPSLPRPVGLSLPLLSEADPRESGEGALDPLGLSSIADALATLLVPGVRERQGRPRFLTAMAVSAAVCEGLEDRVAADGVTSPRLVFEWYFVEGMSKGEGDMRGIPGSQKASQAHRDRVPLSARRYLKSPDAFGFHGIYRMLAKSLGIEESGGRLGEKGGELLRVWEREQQGLPGFVSGEGGSAGAKVRRKLRETVEAGLAKAATDWPPKREPQGFFQSHLNVGDPGDLESKFIADLLRKESSGFRGEVLGFLTSKQGWRVWDGDERAFHAALRARASAPLAELLDAISAYETFSRLCQDAFDDALQTMTTHATKTSPGALGKSPLVRAASKRVPELFAGLRERVEPSGLLPRLDDSFADLAGKGSPEDWIERLLEHHRKVQRAKPPGGKSAWFERFDDGSFIIRPLHRREKGGSGGNEYVHRYRTGPLSSFARDLKLVRS